ncbi:MAG: PilZ domain-containing protein [Thalassobaculaceae bacterium]|nr:PilZ domain-containing protein [Thalassobaculaceae bacterium]
MSEERRNFSRRRTETLAAISTVEGQDLDTQARVVDLSVNGVRLATSAVLQGETRYRVKLAQTSVLVEFVVRERIGDEYRCQFETPWEDLHDVIRQSDDLTLLVLEASHSEEDTR